MPQATPLAKAEVLVEATSSAVSGCYRYFSFRSSRDPHPYSRIDAIPDPPSLTDLRRRCEAMLPRVDTGELILEVMSWEPRFVGVQGGLGRPEPLR